MKYEQTFYDKLNGFQARIFDNGKSSLISNFEKPYHMVPSEFGKYEGVYGGKGDFVPYKWGDGEYQHKVSASQMFMRKYEFNKDFKCLYLDIETHTDTVSTGFPHPKQAPEPISLIQLLSNKSKKVYIIGDKDFFYKEEYMKHPICEGYEVEYIQRFSEKDMLNAFFEILEKECPLVVYAWNGEGFDFPYLYRRATYNRIDTSKFSPFHKFLKEPVKLDESHPDNPIYFANLTVNGCYYIDMEVLYQKLVFDKLPSYSLSNVSQQLGYDKLDHSEYKSFEDFYNGIYVKPDEPTEEQKQTLCYRNYGKVSEHELHKMGHGQFVLYGVIDVILMNKLDQKYCLSELSGNLTNEFRTNLTSVLTTLSGWGSIILREFENSGLMITPAKEEYVGGHIAGGYVRQPLPGIKKWVVSFDVNSMYPSTIISQNMSPECFIDDIVDFAEKNSYNVETAKRLQSLIDKHIQPHLEVDENRLLYLDNEAKDEIAECVKELNVSLSPTGVMFDNRKTGVVPTLVDKYFGLRKQTKALMKEKQKLLKQLKDSL